MNFIKRHYEKILLAAVLLGLTVALALLPFKIASEKQELEDIRQRIIPRKIDELPPLDLSRAQTALQGVQGGTKLDFAGPHNLFNPVPWGRTPEGKLFKIPVRVELPVITKITPLRLILSFESVGAGGANFLTKVIKETETNPRTANQTRYLKVGEKIDIFILREVQGPAENPTALVFDVTDTGERVSVAKEQPGQPGQPYSRVEGYKADLRHETDRRTFLNMREGQRLTFGGEEYVIEKIKLFAPNQYEVILSHRITQKRHVITYSP